MQEPPIGVDETAPEPLEHPCGGHLHHRLLPILKSVNLLFVPKFKSNITLIISKTVLPRVQEAHLLQLGVIQHTYLLFAVIQISYYDAYEFFLELVVIEIQNKTLLIEIRKRK